MRNLHASKSSKNWGLAALVLACGLANCNQADSDKQGEKPNLVQGFTPGGECPNPGSACWVPGYNADCFYEGDPYNCECVPTGLYNAHNWLCEFQGQGGSGGTAGAGGGPSGSGGSPGGSCLGPDGTLFCGGQAPEGCFCDDVCEQAGDCCPDKFFFCGGGPAGSGGSGGGPGGSGGSGGGPGFGSCVGDFGELFCGGASDDGCFCDDVCEQFGDCCPDKFFVCGGTSGSGGSGGGPGGSGGSGGSPGFGSCLAFNQLWCGTISPDGCSCETGCEFFGDCCEDKFFFCDIDGGGGAGGASGGSSGAAGSGTSGSGTGGFAVPATPQR